MRKPALGAIYLVNRYYDPSTAQFLSIDPLVATTGQPYQYAGDDPVNGSDPSGLSGQCGSIWNPFASGSCFRVGWESLSGAEQVADATLPITLPAAGAACVLLSAGCAAVVGVGATTAAEDPEFVDGADNACTAAEGAASSEPALTASQQRAINSLEQNIADTQSKLDAHIADPDAYDNQGRLAQASSPEIRESIINGRVAHLQAEIRAFQGAIDKIRGGG
ncbi:MAG: RHS repeat-associated core domain-containing protein [Acidimicrobiales bacterium]